MKLRDFLFPDGIVVPLPAATLAEATDVLVGRLVAGGVVANTEKLRQRTAELRGDDVLVLGDRAFLLHYRTDAVSQLRVAIGVAGEAIRRDDADEGGPRARVVLLVVAPPPLTGRHLQVVRGFARVLSRDGSVEQLECAASAEECAQLPLFAEYDLAEQLTVRDLMTDRPRTTGPDVPLRTAAQEMIRSGLGALPVVDDEGRLVGMLSERELVRHLLTTQVLSDPMSRHHSPSGGGQKTVREVMTRQVLCVAPEQSIAEVASLMSNKDVERVPVIREGRLVGYLTRGDIVRKLIGS